MDTCSTSRWRPLQTVVDLPELRFERLPLFEIALRELHQIVQSGALVVAADRFVQRPPHKLHRVALLKDHEGKGCRLTRPSESSTYFFTRLLMWLASLSTARCGCLWQR